MRNFLAKFFWGMKKRDKFEINQVFLSQVAPNSQQKGSQKMHGAA